MVWKNKKKKNEMLCIVIVAKTSKSLTITAGNGHQPESTCCNAE